MSQNKEPAGADTHGGALDQSLPGGRGGHNRSAAEAGQAPDEIIATIPKNRREQYQVGIRTYKGSRPFVDLRVHASNGVDSVPTRNGVTIKPTCLEAVIEGLQKAQLAADVRGLLATEDQGPADTK
jgi:hypothetical protein